MTDRGVPGFAVDADGAQNARALQHALDTRAEVSITCPGAYDIATTIFVRSNTHLRFVEGAALRKVASAVEPTGFAHLILNRGALQRVWDENITIEGLSLIVNRVDNRAGPVIGLRGQLALFHVRNATIRRFSCLDLLGGYQFGLQVCSFVGLHIEDVTAAGALSFGAAPSRRGVTRSLSTRTTP